MISRRSIRIERADLFQDPAIRPRVEEIRSNHRGLFFNRNFELNQGSYLTQAPRPFVNLLNEIYHRKSGQNLPLIDFATVSPELVDIEPTPGLTLSWLAEQTLWPAERLQEIVDTIQTVSPQIVLAGPPGTSKTWIAQLIARYLTQDNPKRHHLVQFHPSYSYEAFVEGLRPIVEKGSVTFQPVRGVVLEIANQIGSSDEPHVLVIDEMNRANLPRVLGELMYLFEYRMRKINLQYTKDFLLPRNLWFIGTMNTADRSICSIDAALRRRFDIFECPPDYDILRRYFQSHENSVPSLVDGLSALNAALEERLDRHHTIGHAFFMINPMTPDVLLRIWRRRIYPLIEEYFFDRPTELTQFDASVFWPELID